THTSATSSLRHASRHIQHVARGDKNVPYHVIAHATAITIPPCQEARKSVGKNASATSCAARRKAVILGPPRAAPRVDATAFRCAAPRPASGHVISTSRQ